MSWQTDRELRRIVKRLDKQIRLQRKHQKELLEDGEKRDRATLKQVAAGIVVSVVLGGGAIAVDLSDHADPEPLRQAPVCADVGRAAMELAREEPLLARKWAGSGVAALTPCERLQEKQLERFTTAELRELTRDVPGALPKASGPSDERRTGNSNN